ncbi:MAG: catalase/peroxidase HPI [Candidatus Dormibacteria bacterium]
MAEAVAERTKCPIGHTALGNQSNRDWWPNRLNLEMLHRNSPLSNPLGSDFNYRKAFSALDLESVKKDINKVMTTSQPWWPADYGHYGPLFIRMAWHSAGTYRIADGRGGGGHGAQRFAPLNSWPDNANLDKARRVLWPVKEKYGEQLSWGDLIILAGNCALESMGFATFGFGGGREDIWEPDEDTNWGVEKTWLGDERYKGDRELDNPFGAVQMGLIYVNPEGPNGNPDPLAAARDIRETFSRMAMNDEETVALVAGGHTFGKTHGAVEAKYVGAEPEGAPLEEQGLGWHNSAGTGMGDDTYTSGLEGAWTNNPITWDNGFFDNLFAYDWELSTSPAGAHQWVPKNPEAKGTVPDPHDPSKRHEPVMLTTDLALKVDPVYAPISKRFHEHPEEFADAFSRAWFKLTHRDMGPRSRYLGSLVPQEELIWQDPVPAANHDLVSEEDVQALKKSLLSSGITPAELVRTAWASASTFRQTDKRGGANGARIRLAPQNTWEVNEPERLGKTLSLLEELQQSFNDSQSGGKRISLADLIILGGCAGIEEAARRAGVTVTVPFTPGRTDARQDQTDAESFSVLEPVADGFRNYVRADLKEYAGHLLVEKAYFLSLTAPEMTVLLGGLRSMGVTFGDTSHGVLTSRPGMLTRDFFINILDMNTEWVPSSTDAGVFEGQDRLTGTRKWTATGVDLAFGSNAQLRAISEVYASHGSEARFLHDFVQAWQKVMELDRFELLAK